MATIPTTRQQPAVSAEELLERATALVPVLKDRAFKAEAMRQIPEETVAEIKDAGMVRIATPERFGGNGHEIDLMFRVAMELGRACGSTAWCYAVWTIHNWMVGHWPMTAQEEYFAAGPDTLSSSSFAPNGKLEPVDGGYRLSGHWEFSSGCDSATWALLGAMGERGPVFTLVPEGEFQIVDNWQVSGMKGTGSKDVTVDGAVVPAHRIMPMVGLNASSGAWQAHGRDSYRLPSMAILPFTLCSPLVGIAQGAVDEFVAQLTGKTGPGRSTESVAIQLRVAESSAEVDLARRVMRDDSREMIERVRAGEVLTELDQATYRRNLGFAARLCVQSVNRLFEASGGHALFDSNAMQRFHRDVHAGSHQAALYWDSIGEAYGRAVFGLPPARVGP
jgi:alkylation response protein AidB-like acyl-CoA dehydrogenase